MLVPSSTLAGPFDGAGDVQNLVGQRGLAGVAMPTKSNVADILHFRFGHA